jgi:hypothetical protein
VITAPRSVAAAELVVQAIAAGEGPAHLVEGPRARRVGAHAAEW